VLISRGEWDEADAELQAAIADLREARPVVLPAAFARLGELRRRQGRLDEATSLFDRCTGHPIASLGRAAIALDRGDERNAVELAERHLRRLPSRNRTERAAALELLIRAHAVSGSADDLARARTALEELRDIAEQAQTAPLLGSASLAAGVLAFAAGDVDDARRKLEDAVDLFEKSGAPFEAAQARIHLASSLEKLGRDNTAIAEVDRAIDALTRLDAQLAVSSAQAMRDRLARPRSPAAAAPPRPSNGLTSRELEVLRLISTGLSNQAIAERLYISEHTVHRHVANTLAKLDVPSRSAAVAHAAKLGLL